MYRTVVIYTVAIGTRLPNGCGIGWAYVDVVITFKMFVAQICELHHYSAGMCWQREIEVITEPHAPVIGTFFGGGYIGG